MRFLLALLAAGAVFAESPFPANPAWEHPVGDAKKVPCVHRKKRHPEGCPPPCLHPPVQQHRDGDDGTVPCTHWDLKHPGGHDTGKKGPCCHFKHGVPEHRNGDTIFEPCGHWILRHPGGDPAKVPCVHLVVPHPEGDGGKMPCPHLDPEHPGGDDGYVPCVHSIPEKRREKDPPVTFHFDDFEIQQWVLEGYSKLLKQGIKLRWPRALHVYRREPIKGDPDDNSDPFWSHYDGVQHVMVVTKDPARYTPPAGQDRKLQLRLTVYHEMGHSLFQDRCVQIKSTFGRHWIFKESNPGLAMSEGWGYFISMVLEYERNAAKAPDGFGTDWEGAEQVLTMGKGEKSYEVPFSKRVEFRVAAVLWDLYDTHAEGTDACAIDFRKLYAVFSPSMETLKAGPLVRDLEDYLARLKKNEPGESDRIDRVKSHNLTAPR